MHGQSTTRTANAPSRARLAARLAASQLLAVLLAAALPSLASGSYSSHSLHSPNSHDLQSGTSTRRATFTTSPHNQVTSATFIRAHTPRIPHNSAHALLHRTFLQAPRIKLPLCRLREHRVFIPAVEPLVHALKRHRMSCRSVGSREYVSSDVITYVRLQACAGDG
jgi:hypothetical protein